MVDNRHKNKATTMVYSSLQKVKIHKLKVDVSFLGLIENLFLLDLNRSFNSM